MNIFSYGGGVQSFTILALISAGKLPRPDKIVMADMSPYERETLVFTLHVAEPLARSVGLTIEIVRPNRQTLRDELLRGRVVTPFWWWNDGRAQLVSRRSCTTNYKVKLVNSMIQRYAWDTIWLGISSDELIRVRGADEKLTRGRMRTNFYPLIEQDMTRADCEAFLVERGLVPPPKSACDICPFSSRIRLLKNLAADTGAYERIKEVETAWHKNPKHAHKYLTVYLGNLPTPDEARTMLEARGIVEFDNSGACGVCEF